MEYSHVQKWRYGKRHRMKVKKKVRNKRRNKERKNTYEINTDVFKKGFIAVVVRDCMTKVPRH
jgi:hypothetical protein